MVRGLEHLFCEERLRAGTVQPGGGSRGIISMAINATEGEGVKLVLLSREREVTSPLEKSS